MKPANLGDGVAAPAGTMSSFLSMQSTVRGLWHAIEKLDPPINPRFRPPANEEEIRSAEKSLGLDFPPDLKHFLLCHNGQDFFSSDSGYGDPLIPMMRQPANGQGYSHYWLSGTAEIVESTRRCRDDHDWLQEERFETFGPARYHDKFLDFTGSENADCLVLDLLPEPGGVVGQVVLFSTQAPQIIVLAPNLQTFLQSLVADYNKGRFRHNPCEYFVSYVES
jgi:cell wall assembly regulator SMI1